MSAQEIFNGYLLFALTTAVYSSLYIYKPVVDRLKEEGEVDSILLRRPTIANIVVFIMTAVFAPFFFLGVLSESVKQSIISGFYDGITSEDD